MRSPPLRIANRSTGSRAAGSGSHKVVTEGLRAKCKANHRAKIRMNYSFQRDESTLPRVGLCYSGTCSSKATSRPAQPGCSHSLAQFQPRAGGACPRRRVRGGAGRTAGTREGEPESWKRPAALGVSAARCPAREPHRRLCTKQLPSNHARDTGGSSSSSSRGEGAARVKIFSQTSRSPRAVPSPSIHYPSPIHPSTHPPIHPYPSSCTLAQRDGGGSRARRR